MCHNGEKSKLKMQILFKTEFLSVMTHLLKLDHTCKKKMSIQSVSVDILLNLDPSFALILMVLISQIFIELCTNVADLSQFPKAYFASKEHSGTLVFLD